MFHFTPLLGSQTDSRASQSLLELDGGIKILIDVGWDEQFDVASLQALESHVQSLSIILLTHPTISHLGAFAHLCKHVPAFKSIPVYATTPVVSLGRTLLQDLYASSHLASTLVPSAALAELSLTAKTSQDAVPNMLLQPPSSEEIVSYFSLINTLRYSQPLQPIASPFSPSLDGLTITAYGAGHTLGGTIWHIQHGLESIVYAIDWNQAKENTLSGAAWLGGGGGGAEILEPLRRPTALICGSNGIERRHVPGGRKKRDSELLAVIDHTLAQGGKVLIPSDSSARVLELAYILEQHWRRKLSSGDGGVYKSAKVHLASRTAGSTLRFARSMMEWLDDSLVRETEAENEAARNTKGEEKSDRTPFDFRHVKLVERKSRFRQVVEKDRPAVILASDPSLEWGFSADAMRLLCANPKNLIVLTEHLHGENQVSDTSATTARRLYSVWKAATQDDSVNAQVITTDGSTFQTRNAEVQPLEGEELSVYQQYLARRRQIQSTQQGEEVVSSINPAEVAADDQSSSSSEESEDSDSNQQGRVLNLTAALNTTKRKADLTDAELGVNILLRRKNVYDYDVRGKRGREKMFPYAVKRGRDDVYGDVIRPEDYLRAEERDEDAQAEIANIENDAATGQKRKWADAASKGKDPRRQMTGRRQKPVNDGENAVQAPTTNGASHSESEESDAESASDDGDELLGPRKLVFKDMTLTLKMKICLVDFSGLAEKRDLQMLIPLIKPRKLIITAGSNEETQSLAEDCKILLGEDSSETRVVYTPTTGEMVDVSVDTNSWNIKLTRDLVKKLAWQNVKGLGVVAVTARLTTLELDMDAGEDIADEGARKKLKTGGEHKLQDDVDETSEHKEREVVLDLYSAAAHANNSETTQPIHVGDLRLADLRRLMQANGHVAEFRGEGVLLVDGTVIVRKTLGGRIEVEGGAYMGPNMRYDPTLSFGEVRRRIYEGLAVVAGS